MNNSIYVNGSFDINVWYSYDHDSKTTVSTKSFTYNDEMKLKSISDASTIPEVIVKSLKQPTVSDVSIDSGVVNLSVDKELGVEIVGDTKIKVPIEDTTDDYEIITDEVEEKTIDEVSDDYLK